MVQSNNKPSLGRRSTNTVWLPDRRLLKLPSLAAVKGATRPMEVAEAGPVAVGTVEAGMAAAMETVPSSKIRAQGAPQKPPSHDDHPEGCRKPVALAPCPPERQPSPQRGSAAAAALLDWKGGWCVVAEGAGHTEPSEAASKFVMQVGPREPRTPMEMVLPQL